MLQGLLRKFMGEEKQPQKGGNIPFKNGLYPAPYDPNRGQPSRDIPLTKQMGGMTFANRPGRQYEDESLENGQQGYTPLTSDVARFRGQDMQLGGQWAEDSYTPAAALEKTGYINPQTTQHGGFQQQGMYHPQDTGIYNDLRRRMGL